MKWFLRRYNAFNSVFFLSVCIFAIIKTFVFKENLYEISLVLGLLTFLLSIINSIVYVIDRVIEFEDNELENMYYNSSEQDDEGIFLTKYLKMSNDEISEEFIKMNFSDYQKSNIIKYIKFEKSLKPQRKIRRLFLMLYYFLITLIMAYLFLETELSKCLSGIKIEDFALLSFVIILFEILLRDSVSDALVEYQYEKISKAVSKDLEIIEKMENKDNGQVEDALG